MPELRDVSQREAIRTFERLGGTTRRGKGSHMVVKMPNGRALAVPSGTVKIGLLKHLIRNSGRSEHDFLQELGR